MHIVGKSLVVTLFFLILALALSASTAPLCPSDQRSREVDTSTTGDGREQLRLPGLEVFFRGGQEVDLEGFLLLTFWP